MAEATMTLALSPAVYAGLERRARQHQRRVEDKATLALAAAVSADEALPDDLTRAITALALLDNDALQRVSRTQPTVEGGVLPDALTDKRRREL